MWRAFCMGVGISACLLGGEFLVTDRLILASEVKAPPPSFFGPVVKKREFVPPEWAPWTLLSTGTFMILYSLTLPKSSGGGEPAK